MPRSAQKYLRNLHGCPATLTLQSGRRIEFPRRGMRGDLQPITKEEENDPRVLLNLDLLVELVTEAVAVKAITKQSTNQQTEHPALAILEQASVEMEIAAGDLGEVVAETVDGNIVIKPGQNGGIQRKVGPNVSSAFTGSDAEMPGLLAADDAARNNTDLTSILGLRQD